MAAMEGWTTVEDVINETKNMTRKIHSHPLAVNERVKRLLLEHIPLDKLEAGRSNLRHFADIIKNYEGDLPTYEALKEWAKKGDVKELVDPLSLDGDCEWEYKVSAAIFEEEVKTVTLGNMGL